MSKMTDKLKAILARNKPKVHLHPGPRCGDGKHDSGCAGKGREIVCAKVTVSGQSLCACTHV
jgi:hypothetical protein